MNKKWIVAIFILLAACFIAAKYFRPYQSGEPVASSHSPSGLQPDAAAPLSNVAEVVPAHYESPPSNLPATLAPDKFPGKTRQAYQAAKDIPELLAQLPCYCHCDRGMGHKSLHSCFEDDHAAYCAVCTDEALMAYRLQKDEHLSAKQIRERIIAVFSDSE